MVSVLRDQRTTVPAGVQAKLLCLLTEFCVHDTNDGHELQPAAGLQVTGSGSKASNRAATDGAAQGHYGMALQLGSLDWRHRARYG